VSWGPLRVAASTHWDEFRTRTPTPPENQLGKAWREDPFLSGWNDRQLEKKSQQQDGRRKQSKKNPVGVFLPAGSVNLKLGGRDDLSFCFPCSTY
jgi:hypothetical protein